MTYCHAGKRIWDHFLWENTTLVKCIFFQEIKVVYNNPPSKYVVLAKILFGSPFLFFFSKKRKIKFYVTSVSLSPFFPPYHVRISTAEYVICYEIHVLRWRVVVAVHSNLLNSEVWLTLLRLYTIANKKVRLSYLTFCTKFSGANCFPVIWLATGK